MAEELRWKLKLEEDFGRPSREALKALRDYERGLQRTAREDARRQQQVVRQQERANARRERENARYVQAIARQNAGAWQRDARAQVASMARMDRARARATVTWQRAQERIGRINDRWRDSIVSSVSDGIETIGRLGLGVVGAVAGITAGFIGLAGRITAATLRMVAFREGAVTTSAVLLGGANGPDRAAGEASFSRAQAIARRTPLETRGVIQAQQQAITAGFRGRGADAVLAASTDVGAAMQATDPTAQARFVRALGQIRSRGRLQAEELNQLGEVGVNRDAVFRSIGQQIGLREQGTALNTRVADMMRRGQISGDVGVRASLEAVRTTLSGGTLGGLASRLGGTLAGSMSNLASSAEDFVTSIAGLENLPGIRALAQTVASLGDNLAGATPTGKRLQAVFASILNSVGLLVGRIDVNRVFASIADFAERAGKAFSAAWPTIRGVATAFGEGFLQTAGPSLESLVAALRDFTSGASGANGAATARDLGMAFGALVQSLALTVRFIDAGTRGLVEIYRTMGQFYTYLYTTIVPGFYNLGPALGQGLAQGIRDSWGTVTSTLTELASGLPGPVREALGIASPSRVFAELGRFTAEGFAVGVDRSAPVVESSVRDMVQLPATGGGLGPLVGSMEINVRGGATNDETAEAVRGAVEDALVNLMERAGLLGGAIGAPA